MVVGGGLIGVETAVLFSLDPDNRVTMIEMLPQMMNGCSDCDRIVYGQMIQEHGIQTFSSSRVVAIDEQGVVFERAGRRQTAPADHVFLATGMKPARALFDELLQSGANVYNVGDSQTPGKIYDAIHSGYKAGLKV